eukprot:2726632-Lingulodinium_polyedra.AAC.1
MLCFRYVATGGLAWHFSALAVGAWRKRAPCVQVDPGGGADNARPRSLAKVPSLRHRLRCPAMAP